VNDRTERTKPISFEAEDGDYLMIHKGEVDRLKKAEVTAKDSVRAMLLVGFLSYGLGVLMVLFGAMGGAWLLLGGTGMVLSSSIVPRLS